MCCNRERNRMENFEEAADSRLEDWELLNKAHRKVGTIHCGGIYIECILKAMICQTYQVVQGAKGNKWIIDGQNADRPSHDLTGIHYRRWLGDMYDDMSQDVMDALEYITRPENEGYIDYRYFQETKVPEQNYSKWMECFVMLFDFLQEKMREI